MTTDKNRCQACGIDLSPEDNHYALDTDGKEIKTVPICNNCNEYAELNKLVVIDGKVIPNE